jgi:CHU_C Type IX secretion signal domain
MRTLLTLTLIIQSLHLLAQPANLVPNGGFEDRTNCPTAWSEVPFMDEPTISVKNWFKPTNGTPDYYSTCSQSQYAGLPSNLLGFTEPKEGTSCAGLLIFHSNELDGFYFYATREYLSVRLSGPLQAGHTYCVGMYVSTAERIYGNELCHQYTLYHVYASNALGMSLTDSLYVDTLNRNTVFAQATTPLPQQAQVEAQEVMTDTTRWYLIQGSYTAQGGEEWLTIGNFKSDSALLRDMVKIREGLNMSVTCSEDQYASYVFIDQVFVYDQAGPSRSAFAQYPTGWCASNFPDTLRTNELVTSAVWSTGQTGTNAIEVTDPGWYIITGYLDGCPIMDSVEVVAESPLEVAIAGPRLIANCAPDGRTYPIEVRSTLPLPNYKWQVNHRYRTDSVVVVRDSDPLYLTSTNDCGTFSDSVEVLGCQPGPLYIPNVFWPESGDVNGYFNVFGHNILIEEISVFDVWGQRVYHVTGEPGMGWDGRAPSGQACAAGVYLWVVRYRAWDFQPPRTLRGDVTLVR